VNEDIKVTYASLLRSILRQDPDTILVGEVRDLETAPDSPSKRRSPATWSSRPSTRTTLPSCHHPSFWTWGWSRS
jgi:hypothetical protein